MVGILQMGHLLFHIPFACDYEPLLLKTKWGWNVSLQC